MAYFFTEPSRTFSEYLLVPGYSSAECVPANVSLKTPVVKYRKGEECPLTMNVPMVSAVMQAVSGEKMGVGLAREGGIAFIYVSQPVEQQAAMVRQVKNYKAGFVTSDTNLRVGDTLAEVLALKERSGHSTMPVTDDGTGAGKLLGLVTSRDYRVSRMDPSARVETFMTPIEKLIASRRPTTFCGTASSTRCPSSPKTGGCPASSSGRTTTATRTTRWSCWTARSVMWWGPVSTRGTMNSGSPRWSRPVWTCWSSTRRRDTPNGRPGR